MRIIAKLGSVNHKTKLIKRLENIRKDRTILGKLDLMM